MAQYLPQAQAHPQQRGGLAGYLLGMGPMPAPGQQEIAIAGAIHGLDNPKLTFDLEGDNIDPQPREEGMHDNGIFPPYAHIAFLPILAIIHLR